MLAAELLCFHGAVLCVSEELGLFAKHLYSFRSESLEKALLSLLYL